MPIVHISLFQGKTAEYKKAILEGVHGALMEAFKIPDSDRNQRISEFDSEAFEINPGQTGCFTLIELTVFQGRSQEAKKRLYSAIVRNLEASPGIPGNDVTIILHEVPMENWGIRGGKPGNEVDLGFNVRV